MKSLYFLAAVLPFIAGCSSECGYGTQRVGRNIAITGPSGNIATIGTINTGSIQDQSVYTLTSQRVTDLVQQMQICCTNKLRAQKTNDQANVAWWTNEEHKCFEQMLDLQSKLPPSNAPATVAPAVGTAPKLASETTAASNATGGPSKPTPAPKAAPPAEGPTALTQSQASTAKVEGWLKSSGKVLRGVQKNTAAHATSNLGQ
jgi:hypothetical protein